MVVRAVSPCVQTALSLISHVIITAGVVEVVKTFEGEAGEKPIAKPPLSGWHIIRIEAEEHAAFHRNALFVPKGLLYPEGDLDFVGIIVRRAADFRQEKTSGPIEEGLEAGRGGERRSGSLSGEEAQASEEQQRPRKSKGEGPSNGPEKQRDQQSEKYKQREKDTFFRQYERVELLEGQSCNKCKGQSAQWA